MVKSGFLWGIFLFRGINALSIDSKGRFAMPTRYRNVLQKLSHSELVITIDTEVRCLLLYPFAEWEILEHKIESLPSFNKAARRIQRLLIGHATELTLDSQGRVLIPPLLREYATINKNLVLLGQGKKFELWDECQWKEGRDSWLANPAEPDEIPDALRLVSL